MLNLSGQVEASKANGRIPTLSPVPGSAASVAPDVDGFYTPHFGDRHTRVLDADVIARNREVRRRSRFSRYS